MEVHIKMTPAQYKRLCNSYPIDSPVRDLIDNARRLDHAIEGVLFAGYTIVCNQDQARIFLETARKCCPEVIPQIEQAIKLAQAANDR
jgi:hypothetical protein